MELQSLSRPSEDSSLTRRAWLLAPVGMIGVWWLARQRPLPSPSENGTGETVTIVLFAENGRRLQTVRVKQVVKSLDEWRKQLEPEAFEVTRQQGTEFAFHNLYWNNHRTGLYRCICCATAVFRSLEKYDSDTGWPSFTAPITVENIETRPDGAMGLRRTEVLCRKCDAHLGHLFNDGPPPKFSRYCLNSAALRFIAA